MAVNKNFVVKNGLEVNTDLIVADVDSSKVGVGTTISSYLLHVYQGTGIGASSVYVTGISTVAQEFNVGLGGTVFTVLGNAEGTAGIGQSVGVGTAEPAYLLDVRSPVSTGQTALYVQGDMRVTGDINLDDLRLDQLNVSGISTFVGFSTFAAGINVLGLGATTTTLEVTGLSTFTGIGTFQSDLYVGGDLFIKENISLDTNLNILGIATIGTLAVTGVGTAALFGGYAALSAPASAETKNFAVTVAAKTSNNRYSGGSSNAYYIDGIEAPFLTLTPGRTYRFTLSSSDMSSHPFRFYLEADKTTAYTTDVTSTSTYTEIIVTDTTPTVLHYQCSSHGYMGNSVQTNSNTIVVSAASTFSGVIDSNNATQSSSSTTGSIIASGGVGIAKNLYVGGGSEITGILTVTNSVDFNSDLDVDGHTELDNVAISGIVTVTGNIDANSDADINGDLNVNGHTDLDFVIVSAATTFQSDIFVGTGATVGFGTTAYFEDHAKAIFGTDDDLKIYHDGSNSYVQDDGTGALRLQGSQIQIKGSDTNNIALFKTGADVELYYNNDKKFETTGYGVTVSGGAFVSGISTFVGFVTFSDYAFVQDGLNVAGVVTATSFDGLGQIGVGSEGTFIGVGITMVDFKSSNASNTVDVDGTSGIATVTVTTGVSIGLAIALGG